MDGSQTSSSGIDAAPAIHAQELSAAEIPPEMQLACQNLAKVAESHVPLRKCAQCSTDLSESNRSVITPYCKNCFDENAQKNLQIIAEQEMSAKAAVAPQSEADQEIDLAADSSETLVSTAKQKLFEGLDQGEVISDRLQEIRDSGPDFIMFQHNHAGRSVFFCIVPI